MQAQRFGANKIVWARTAAWIPVSESDEQPLSAVRTAESLERQKARDGKWYCHREFTDWYSFGGCPHRNAYATSKWNEAINNKLSSVPPGRGDETSSRLPTIAEKSAEETTEGDPISKVGTWRQKRFSGAHESVEFSPDEIIKMLPSVNFSPDEIIKLMQ